MSTRSWGLERGQGDQGWGAGDRGELGRGDLCEAEVREGTTVEGEHGILSTMKGLLQDLHVEMDAEKELEIRNVLGSLQARLNVRESCGHRLEDLVKGKQKGQMKGLRNIERWMVVVLKEQWGNTTPWSTWGDNWRNYNFRRCSRSRG